MTAAEKSRRSDRLGAITIGLALVALAGLAALSILGWAAHGETLFLSALAAGWATCF